MLVFNPSFGSVLMQFRVQTLVCVPSRQPKCYHPTQAARAGTPGMDFELPASTCTITFGSMVLLSLATGNTFRLQTEIVRLRQVIF